MMGTRVDEVTMAEGLNVDCAGKAIVFRMAVAADMADITPEGWDAVHRAFNIGQCSSTGWRPLIDNGWALSNSYIFRDGGTRTFTASCDALGAPPTATPGPNGAAPEGAAPKT